MKLTKTERTLLEEAARKPSGTLYAMTWWSSTAKCHSNGRRAANALRSLCDKGLADSFQAESNSEPNIDGFGSTYATEFAAKITAAGREAIR